MKVGIDTFGCNHGKSGIGSYLSSFCAQLHNSEEISFELFGAEIDRYTFGADNGLTYKAVNLSDSRNSELLWHFFRVDRFAKKQGYDAVIYAAGAQFIPLHCTVPGVAVINDVVSELYSTEKFFFQKQRILLGLRNITKIICASHFIRKDLIKLGIPGEKISVIHNGINHSEFYPREILSPNLMDIKPFAIKRPYFIYASRMCSETKKHIQLIRAFNIFKSKTRLEHRLVFSGSEGDVTEEIKKEILASPFASEIFITGFFPHESFPLLYAGSDGCIFPSVNEGVALPVLEAMATGVPVACSKDGALPEIAGSNAIFFDSDNINEMAMAMESIAVDKTLRKKLKEGGLKWTKSFDWEKTVKKTVEVIKSVST